jgi:steroid delta-isomerase-like uncharacterized protein
VADPQTIEEFIRYGCIQTINQGDTSRVAELFADDLAFHRSGEVRGLAELEADTEMWREGFPDVEATIEEVVSEEDRAMFRYTIRGTHEGEFEGIPPTGERIEAQGVGFARLEDDEITEYDLVFDGLGMLQQLGVVDEWEGKQ